MEDSAVVWLYEHPDLGPQNIPYEFLADAAIAIIRAKVLEEAAKVAEAFPARTHGNLATAPYAAAEQAAEEIATAIRALKEKA